MSAADRTIQGVSIACSPERGWVTIMGRLSGEVLEYPVVDLAILSPQGDKLAETMIVDAPLEFQMTLHVRGVPAGAPLVLRVVVLQGENTVAVREYEFEYLVESE
jgi:hypothetical protein